MAALLMLLWFMMQQIFPNFWSDCNYFYGYFAIAFMSGIYWCKRGFAGPVEAKILLIFAIWIFLSRLFIGDVSLVVDGALVLYGLLTFIMFVAGVQLDKIQRDKLMMWLTITYGGFYLISALVCLFVTVTNTYIQIPPEGVRFSVSEDYSGKILTALFVHRNVLPTRFFIAWCLMIYQMFRCKNKLWLIPLGFSALLLHFVIPLCHCRSIQVAMSVSFAMLALLICMELFKMRSAWLRVAFSLVTTIAALFLFYGSFNMINLAMSKLQEQVAPRFEAYYTRMGCPADPEIFGIVKQEDEDVLEVDTDTAGTSAGTAAANAENADSPAKAASEPSPPASEETNFVDNRSIVENTTLSGRTAIWKAVIPVIKNDPSIALFGSSTLDVMEPINAELGKYKPHMHNVFFQVLMVTGVPGLLLILGWTLLMVRNMLKIFFCKKNQVDLAIKSLTVPVAGLLVYNLAEVILFVKTEISGLAFFLIGGILLANYYEIFPDSWGADTCGTYRQK